MKNIETELEDLMRTAKVQGLRRKVIRGDFGQLEKSRKNAFIDNFQWEIIQDLIKNRNYND